MYQRLLTRRYLSSKIMPLLAAAAVTLCAMMVLIVWSVMGGFLNMLLASGKAMIGDASISWPLSMGGLTHYEEVIAELESRDEVAAATPMIETFALASFPGLGTTPVQLVGVEPEGYDLVTDFADRLYWRPLDEAERAQAVLDRERALAWRSGGGEGDPVYFDPRLDLDDRVAREVGYGARLSMPHPQTGEEVPAVVPGISVTGINKRTRGGWVRLIGPRLANGSVDITVMPQDENGNPIDLDLAETRTFQVANEFSSGLYEADAKWVIVPLADLQEMLHVDAAGLAADGPAAGGGALPPRPQTVGTSPAKVSHILIRGAEGVTPKQVQAVAEEVYAEVARRHDDMRPAEFLFIYTWEERPGLAQYIAAVKRETVMVVTLFAVISSVAAFLIFSIFWSMVSEKTKDIGILRALGASRGGIAWLFLRYGLSIGVIGAIAGLLLAWLFIHNINAIHSFLAYVLGVEIWSAETYMFTRIPSDLDWVKAALVVVGAIVFSLIGALLPAIRAARMDPVRALRFE